MSPLDQLNFGWRRRLPMMLQTEAAECGLVSLAMIASYFGYQVGPTELRRRFGLSLKGASLKELIRIADEVGLASRPVRLDMDELPFVKMPCILHWDLNHFVVLKSVGRKDAVIHDPAVGPRRVPLTEVSRHFTGVAVVTDADGRLRDQPAAATRADAGTVGTDARDHPIARSAAVPCAGDRGLRADRAAVPGLGGGPGAGHGRPQSPAHIGSRIRAAAAAADGVFRDARLGHHR